MHRLPKCLDDDDFFAAHLDDDDFFATHYVAPPPPDILCIAGCVVISWVFAIGIVKAGLQLCGLW
jgi:hypothetical protein